MDGTDAIGSKHSADSNGLELSEQPPIDATVTVDLDGRSPTEVWADLCTDRFRTELVDAVLDAGRGRTSLEYHDLLENAEIDALHGSFRSLVVRTADGDKSALWSFLRETGEFGNGSPIMDAVDVARLFTLALENQPDRDVLTMAFEIGLEFQEQKASQRRKICAIITELSRGCDVHIVGDTGSQQWLIDSHRSDLPVSSESKPTPTHGPLSELVDAALGKLNPDGREAMILRYLSDEATGTFTYHSLYSAVQVDESRVRQCISRLEGLGLVNTFDSKNNRKVELLEAGSEYLSEVSRQSTLDETPPKQSQQTRGTRPTGEGREDGHLYQTTVARQSNKTAAGAIGLDNDVALVKEPVCLDQTEQERKTKPVSYDEDRDVATVSVRAAAPTQLACSTATALTMPWFWDDELPNGWLKSIDEPEVILQGARNIGLSDEALNDPGVLRDQLVKRGQEIESLSTDLRHADPEDKPALASEIMKKSHGLTASVISLFDAAGIDVVREIRLASDLSRDQLERISETLARSILMQSKYESGYAVTPYRHLLKTDAGKPAITPQVDASDAAGSLIGSFVIRGKDVHRLREPLEAALSSPGEFLDEPVEFAIPISVREVDRSEFALITTRMLKSRNIKPTREAVSILHTLMGSPYDAAQALNQLDSEDSPREVRPDELRYGLSALEPERILPELPPTVGKIVYELLQATEPLSQAELAKRAGVSTQSIRNNKGALRALSIVSIERGAWRLNLSFRTTEERRSHVTPELVGSSFTDAVDALLTAVLPPERYGDPDDPVGGALFWPADPWRLATGFDVSPWVRLAARLTGTERPDNETSISVGPAIDQTAITETEAMV